MELVKGVRITDYCDEHHLSAQERLELFIPICQAVQHAHQKGIIHRDLKPGNVLIALYDDRAVPRVIDFGVAKATEQKLTEKTMFTQFGQIVGTLDYMSPEQADLNQLDIDTRSDVYSLGVLLYELLTGETPTDIQRYLRDEPVVACPPSATYRLRKFLRRNRLPITTMLAIVAAITVAVSLGVTAHRRGLREVEFRRLAEIAQREKTEAELDALVEEGLHLSSGLYPDFTAAVDCFTRVLKARPEESSLYLFRGSAYYQWGKPNEALADLERALELSREDNFAAHHLIALTAQDLGDEEKAALHRLLAQEQTPESVEALVAQASALQYDEHALELMNRAIEKRPFDPMLYSLRGQICTGLANEFGKAEHYQRAQHDLEMALVARPDDDRIHSSLCRLRLHGNRAAEDPAASRAKGRELLEAWLQREPDRHLAQQLLMAYYSNGGQAEKALAVLSEEQLNGPLPWGIVGELGRAYRRLGDYEKSLELSDRAIETGGGDWVYFLRAISYAKLGKDELARRDIEEARGRAPRTLSRHALCIFTCSAYEALGDDEAIIRTVNARLHKVPSDATAHITRAWAHTRLGQSEKGLADLDKAIQLDPKLPWAFTSRGDHYRELGNLEAAIADYSRAIELEPSHHGAISAT